jgi:hypothetical protein
MQETWREKSRRIIQCIIDDNPGLNETEQRKLVRLAYPYAQRSGWAYKAWLAAVKDAFAEGKALTKSEVRNMWIK